MFELVCPPDGGDRLDKVIAQLHPGTSRSQARRLIADGSVFVEGRRCRIASRLVHAGEHIRVSAAVAVAAGGPLTVVYEDDDCVAIDKPAGMPSAPTQTAAAGTALEVLQMQRRGPAGKCSLWVVHRLDAATSGVLLFAKNRRAAAPLSAAVQGQLISKPYNARVGGRLESESGVIDLPLATRRGRAVVSKAGRPASTAWRVVHADESTTRLELQPRSGRLHQLRVHLQAIGHPVVGDRAYGGLPAARLMLHAWRLELPASPTQGARCIEAPIPAGIVNS